MTNNPNKNKLPRNSGKFEIDKAVSNGEPVNTKDATKQNSTKQNSTALIEEVRDQSIQSRFDDDQPFMEVGAGGVNSLSDVIDRSLAFIFQSGDLLPPWWSTRRDAALTLFWKEVNLLSGAMYTLTSKMTTIPFHIEPRDMAITAHLREAARFEKRLNDTTEGGKGWGEFFSKQVQSLLGQDNGRFMEIIDLSPNKLGPLIGPAISVAHLDPSRCTRTSDPEFPVLYRERAGGLHKLHYTRVAFEAQLPSERVDMYGVGVCAVSRSSAYAQNMMDISKYKEEKLGSRPNRGIILAGGGLDAEAVGNALMQAGGMSDNAGLSRFSMLPILGDPDIETPSLDLVSLSQMPDGFDEVQSTDIAMAAISLAFGVDARELWPQRSGTNRADALLSHIKQRGKGPGQILVNTERMFNNWYLPPHLKMVFDFQDDAQDRQRAEIGRELSLTRKNNLTLQVTTDRVERENMVRTGEISSAQFKNLELENGRLPDGTPLETVFFKDTPIYKEILTLPGIPNPLDIRGNNPEQVLDAISAQIPVAMEILADENRQIQQRQARESLDALRDLEKQYQKEIEITLSRVDPNAIDITTEELPPEGPPSENRQGDREGAESNPEDETAIGVRPSDEANMNQENSPREFTGKDMTGEQLDFLDDLEVTNIKRDWKGNIKSFFTRKTNLND